MFDSHGADADRINVLWWLMLAISVAVFVVVLAFLAYALFRKRDPAAPSILERRPLASLWFILSGGAVVPLVILVVVWGFTLHVMASQDSLGSDAVRIDVNAQQFWWQVTYPDQQFTTANEIHIPVGKTVEIRLTSPDVIHSFWVPQLAGKTDVIPGQTNTMRVKANAPGTYRGQCAEFCGIAHANMAFEVVAENQQQFDQWVTEQRQPSAAPTDPKVAAGQQIFLGSQCIQCHAIRGTSANRTVAPDLTHVASRSTIGAGTLRTDPEDVTRWLSDPQKIKPGTKMPAAGLDDDSIQRLVAYLESLR